MKRKIFIGIGILLIGLQFITIDKNNPSYAANGDFINVASPSQEIKSLLVDACYDCHSYNTEYDWYTNISPLSLWIGHHIEEGREHLNFSIWTTYEKGEQDHKIEECIEELEEGEMPLKSYTWMHPEANLTPEQKEQLTAWFKSL